MRASIEMAPELIVVGLEVRTSPASAATDIPKLWQRFMAENVAGILAPSATDRAIYALYLDYESDYRGAYSMVVGVSSASEAPAGMRRVHVPAGRYARFHAAGDPAQVIWQTWSHINELWSGRTDRSYRVDYERYDAGALALGRAEADIFVGVG